MYAPSGEIAICMSCMGVLSPSGPPLCHVRRPVRRRGGVGPLWPSGLLLDVVVGLEDLLHAAKVTQQEPLARLADAGDLGEGGPQREAAALAAVERHGEAVRF